MQNITVGSEIVLLPNQKSTAACECTACDWTGLVGQLKPLTIKAECGVQIMDGACPSCGAGAKDPLVLDVSFMRRNYQTLVASEESARQGLDAMHKRCVLLENQAVKLEADLAEARRAD